MKRLLTGVLLACAASLAHADTWRVDLLVFAHEGRAGAERARPAHPVQAEAAIPLEERARLEANGIRILSPEDSRLNEHWRRLHNATAFRPLLRLSWTQRDPPPRGGPSVLLRHGRPLLSPEGEAVRQLEGVFRLTLRRYLHLDADLRWSERDAMTGLLRSWPLREQRRMQSESLHYIDSARLGLLVEIRRADQRADDTRN